MNVRIVLACNHVIMREGLRSLLERRSDMEVVGEAEDGRHAVQLAAKQNPDVVLLSIDLPELNGIDATRQILVKSPDVKAIVLSLYSNRKQVLDALEAGVSGYLLKSCSFEELTHAVHVVSGNQIYLSPCITGLLVNNLVRRRNTAEATVFSTLTTREREVLQLIAEGNNTKEIAVRLKVSVKTVEFHRQQVMKKLNLRNVASLTKYAIREGLTTLDE